MNLREEIESILKPLPKRIPVLFSLHCAEDSFHLVHPEDKAKAEECISLIKEWLRLGPSPELEQKLRAAISASAFYSASAYAYAYASASYSAFYSSSASASASKYEEKMKEYKAYLLDMLRDMPKIEKLIYNVEDV